MVVTLAVILFTIIDMSSGVIYHLNESEYERMPPLFKMDWNYRSCLMQPGGVYCVAKFDLHGDPHSKLFRMITEFSQHEIRHYNHSYIDRAICVTQSCNKFIQNKDLDKIVDLNRVLEGCINETMYTEYGLEAKLAHVHSCDKLGDEVHLGLGEWILAGILISLLVLNLIGSVYDFLKEKSCKQTNNTTGKSYLMCFSIFRNWDKLSNTNTEPRYERLNGIHGIKSMTTFFVASSHVMWLVGTGYTDNPREFEMSQERLHYQLIFSGMVIVQIYFVISGFLLAFHLQVFSETKTLSWKSLLKMLFSRWARLTPAYAVMVLFTATWLRHLGSGPLWKMFVGNVAIDCRTHWWRHLLYFNNYVKEDKFCAVQSWHVATEMQLFVIGLTVYMVTSARGRHLALAVLALLGLVAPALHVWLQDLDALVIHKPEFYRAFDGETYRSMHVLGHNNLCCYVIGMAVGVVSYYCIQKNIEYRNNKLLKFVTWCIPAGIVGLFLSGALFYVDGDRPHVGLRMAYAAIQRPALGVMIAFLVLNLILKFECSIRSVLEWRGWRFTSRLCYSIFLLHVNFIHILLGTRTQLGHVSFFYVVINHLGVVSLTFLVSIPFYLLLEAPLISLTKLLIEDPSEEKQKKIK